LPCRQTQRVWSVWWLDRGTSRRHRRKCGVRQAVGDSAPTGPTSCASLRRRRRAWRMPGMMVSRSSSPSSSLSPAGRSVPRLKPLGVPLKRSAPAAPLWAIRALLAGPVSLPAEDVSPRGRLRAPPTRAADRNDDQTSSLSGSLSDGSSDICESGDAESDIWDSDICESAASDSALSPSASGMRSL
jgi:hypothetical protein